MGLQVILLAKPAQETTHSALMEWTVRRKGDFQPERFVPVKEGNLRLLL